MANIYDINWKNVGKNLLFWRWRTTRLVAFIDSIMSSVQVLSDKLFNLDAETRDFLQYTGQHKVLEEYLNDKYDSVQRRIYITENNIGSIDPIQMGLSGESVPEDVEIGLSGESVTVPLVIALSNEVLQANNFTINIPIAVLYVESTLTAQVNNYVLAGKQYNINVF